MLTGAVYRFSEALDELGPFGMILLGTMSALGVSQSSHNNRRRLLVEGVGVQLILLHLQHFLIPVAQTQNAIQTQGEGVEAQGSEASSAPSAEQMASGGVGVDHHLLCQRWFNKLQVFLHLLLWEFKVGVIHLELKQDSMS